MNNACVWQPLSVSSPQLCYGSSDAQKCLKEFAFTSLLSLGNGVRVLLILGVETMCSKRVSIPAPISDLAQVTPRGIGLIARRAAISALHFQQNTNIDTQVLFVAFGDGRRANAAPC